MPNQTRAVTNPLIRKLDIANSLTDEDRAILARLSEPSRVVEARQDLTLEGDRPENVHLIMSGFACRYKLLPDGSRQIMALLIPGDFCDLHVSILGAMDHSIATLSPCLVVTIPRSGILDLTNHHPRINHALWWATLVDEAILREWLVNLAKRPAEKRIGHFYCELLVRLQTVGLADATSYDMPFTQIDLGDILGLTSVHMSRVLRELRTRDLIALKRQRLDILDVNRLKAFCDFDPNYLHLVPRIERSSG